MHKLRSFFTRLINTLRKAPSSEDFKDEIETHVAMDTERGIRDGLSPAEARRQALVRFGGVAQAQNAYSERQGLPALDSLLRDVHYSLRSLLRNRLVTAVAILSIGLGIGSNTTIFSVVSRFVLRPAPVGDPSTLLSLHVMHDGDRCCNQFPWPVSPIFASKPQNSPPSPPITTSSPPPSAEARSPSASGARASLPTSSASLSCKWSWEPASATQTKKRRSSF